jgi:hypothetical protein
LYRAPAFVAVTFNRNRPRGVLFEHRGVAIKHALTLGREIAAVEFENTGRNGELRFKSSSEPEETASSRTGSAGTIVASHRFRWCRRT